MHPRTVLGRRNPSKLISFYLNCFTFTVPLKKLDIGNKLLFIMTLYRFVIRLSSFDIFCCIQMGKLQLCRLYCKTLIILKLYKKCFRFKL